MAKNKKIKIALIYDFDGTLSPGNMQEYDFLKSIEISNKNKFWEENSKLAKNNNASEILCWMRLMIEKSKAKRPIKRETFIDYGRNIKLYKGVKEWFDVINELGKKNNVIVEHYIISSGLKEMIEGTPIKKKFKQIYACSFMYDENGVAIWPAVSIDFTAKTQFLFMINKGIADISDNKDINNYTEEEKRPIPFTHMIYLGDGDTDIPCMKLVKEHGGVSIAVYKPKSKDKKKLSEQLIKDERVNFVCPADYTKGKELYNIVDESIKHIKSNHDYMTFQKKHNGNKKEEK